MLNFVKILRKNILMSPAFSRMRLIVALLAVMLLSTSCGSLTSVRGDDIYYADNSHKDNKNKPKQSKNRKNKDRKHTGKNKKTDAKNKTTDGKSNKNAGKMSKSGKGGGSSNTPFRIPQDLDDSTLALIREALSWIGTPYVYGGETKDGADCSGFVMMTYKNALGIKLPRTSADQGEFCENIDKKKLEVGDLVFFHGGKGDKVNHVGIYVGDGKFIHASSSKGVMISDLDMKYFADRYHHSGKVKQLHKMRKK